MSYAITTATFKLTRLQKRIRAVPGGTSAGKTIGILEVLIDLAQRDKRPTLTSVVAESFPHLRRGAMRDFLSIMQTPSPNGIAYFKDARWDITNSTYTFETGSKIEFFSVDQPAKVRGARRDRLFINEANNIHFSAFEELEVRTRELIFLDWNPTNEFWYYTDIKGKRQDVDELTLTYLDNEALDPAIVASIEARRERKDWWQVYALGQLGQLEGQIYRDWGIVDEVPHSSQLRIRGLDFGYTNDPTAVVDIYAKTIGQSDGVPLGATRQGFVWDESLFQKGLSNRQIADVLLNLPKPETLVVADSSEPKSIDEIKSYGINIIAAAKGPDSVVNGIQLVQSNPHWITKRSTNILKEQRNYLWMVDKDGKVINVPEHQFSHSMDAGRYGETALLKKPKMMSMQASPILPGHYPEIGI